MHLLSLNVGLPREVVWNGKVVSTGIFKEPISDKRAVSFLNIDGDKQADLRYHGGQDKAIYAYDISYYEHWETVLERESWEMGLFGENLTTAGLLDREVKIGSIYKIGTTTLQAIQPRFPCYKVNIRFGLPDMIERFFAQKRHGTYFRVLEEGHIQTGDNIELVQESEFSITIQDVVECLTSKGSNQEKLKEILTIPVFPERMKELFHKFLN